jgi:hypothetical protein
MKLISENGARPVFALGGLKTQPFGRLGALVFQPHNSESLYWASPRASTRIAGCAWASRSGHPLEKRFVPKRASVVAASSSSRWLPGLPQKRTSSRLRRKQRISFSLCTVIAERMPRDPGRGPCPCPDGCLGNPRTDRALRLHCCRALSSQPQENLSVVGFASQEIKC